MLVVAFDGLLFDTLPLRSAAIAAALSAEGYGITDDMVRDVVASRSIAEAVRACALISIGASQHNPSTGAGLDETALDLATLRAERAAGEVTSRGAVLNVSMRHRLQRAATVTRIVVRADSLRRDVEPLLAMAELDSIVSFVRCADDGDRATAHGIGSMVEKSYADITRRMAGNMNLLGERSAIGIALELSDSGRAAARMLGFDTPETLSAATLPGAP
ncbi:MAG: hypothetical protein ABI120_19240 [Gemmatimonadaceae bacterium]